MKVKSTSALIALWLLTFSLIAVAQQPAKVGDLLEKGGKKLTKDELAKLVTGATMTGAAPTNPDMKTESVFKNDGSLSGTARSYVGRGISTYSGKWWLNDQGQLCSDVTNASTGQRSQRCVFFFGLGTGYYVAPTEDRTATLLERQVIR